MLNILSQNYQPNLTTPEGRAVHFLRQTTKHFYWGFYSAVRLARCSWIVLEIRSMNLFGLLNHDPDSVNQERSPQKENLSLHNLQYKPNDRVEGRGRKEPEK